MLQRRTLARSGLFVTTAVLLGTTSYAWERCNGGLQHGIGRHGYWSFGFSGFRAGYVPEYQGNLTYSPNGQLKRYYDATGRWTGDGYDSMSTAKPNRSNQ